jgi:dienelactone hydrolase
MRISGVTIASRKTYRARNIFLMVLIIVLLAVISVFLISAYNAYAMIHPETKPIAEFSSNIVPEYRDINIKSSEKTIILNGWFFQTKNSDKTVIIAHSNGNNRLEFGVETIDLYKSILAEGYNVFALDLRSSGKSSGKNTTLGYLEKDDILAAVNYARQQGAKHIVVMGFSTGATAGLLAAEEDSSIEAVIADTPYTSLGQYVDGYLHTTVLPGFIFKYTILKALDTMAQINSENCNPAKKMDSLSKCSMLFIHSKNDSYIQLDENRDFYSELLTISNGKSELWETSAEGHAQSFSAGSSAYMSKVSEFLKKLK